MLRSLRVSSRKKKKTRIIFVFLKLLLGTIIIDVISPPLSHSVSHSLLLLFSITITLHFCEIHNRLTLAGASGLRGKIDRPILGQLEARRSRVPPMVFWLFRSVFHRLLQVSSLFTQLFSYYWQTYYYNIITTISCTKKKIIIFCLTM